MLLTVKCDDVDGKCETFNPTNIVTVKFSAENQTLVTYLGGQFVVKLSQDKVKQALMLALGGHETTLDESKPEDPISWVKEKVEEKKEEEKEEENPEDKNLKTGAGTNNTPLTGKHK